MADARAPLDAARVRAVIPPSWSLTVVDETGSTNTDLLSSGAPHGTVLVAEHQTAGRGRLDRTWTSPPRSGLTFSVLLHPDPPRATWGWLPLLAGLAVCDAVAHHVDASLKWPNDLLVSGRRKAGGILVQVDGDAAVAGIGLNVSTTAEELPVPNAASLATAGAVDLDRTALLGAILGELGRRYGEWSSAGGDAQACGLADAYASRCATLGQTVSVATAGGGSFAGVATGIDAEGRLRVGADRVVAAGDVEHIRPANH